MNKYSTLIIAAVLALAGADFASAGDAKAYGELAKTAAAGMQAATQVPEAALPARVGLSVAKANGGLYQAPEYMTNICDARVTGIINEYFATGVAVLVMSPEAMFLLPPQPVVYGCDGGWTLAAGNTLLELPSKNWKEVRSGTINILEIHSLLGTHKWFTEGVELAKINSYEVAYSIKTSPWALKK